MSRAERKEVQKSNKKTIGKKYICILLVFFLLISGIRIVDDSYRYMMMIEEPKVFEHKQVNEKLHEICFCGEKFYIDEQKIYDTYGYVKNEIEVFWEILKEKKKTICKQW